MRNKNDKSVEEINKGKLDVCFANQGTNKPKDTHLSDGTPAIYRMGNRFIFVFNYLLKKRRSTTKQTDFCCHFDILRLNLKPEMIRIA